MSFWAWFISRSIMSSRFIRVVAGVKTSLLSKEEENFILRAPHFVCPFTPYIGGRSGHFYLGRRLLGTTPQRRLVCDDPSWPLHSLRWAPAQQWDRGSRGSSLFQFWGTAVPHSTAAAPFYLPRGPSSSTPLPTLISCWCFGNSHPSGRDAVPRGRDPAVLCMESRTQRRLVSRSGGERGPARMPCLKSLLVCRIS